MARPNPNLPTLTPQQITAFNACFQIGNDDECWEWQGTRSNKGYGQFCFAYKQFRAHRIAYWLHYQTQPAVLLVCHRCDFILGNHR